MLDRPYTRGKHPNSLANQTRTGRPKTKAKIERFRLTQIAADYLAHFSNKTRMIEDLIMNAIAQYPTELYASDEFGGFTLICSPEQYADDIRSNIDAGFSEDFNPEPQIWSLIDPVNGIYETTYVSTADGKHRQQTVKAKMLWCDQLGSFKAEEI